MKMRSATFVGSLMLVSVAISTLGCGSNTPVTSPGAGGSTGAGGVTATGGAATGGAATGGAATGGTIPVTATGGATTTVPSTGGSTTGGSTSTTGVQGTGGSTTTTGTGGSTPTGGTTGSNTFTPSCTGLTTAAGPAPTKAGACTAADPQLCYKTCGPQSIGFKSETCTAGAYAEQSGCSFLATGDYSCYKLPTAVDPTCPTVAPQANTACTVAPCVLCGGSATAQTTGYLDSSGAAKAGFCVCPASTTGSSKWSCASTTAWPCPQGSGC